MTSRLLRPAALALLLASGARPAAAGGVAAVLSYDGGAYLEAFSAFREAYGKEVPRFDISAGKPELPPGTDIVVAFGGKAASYRYPSDVTVVYCLAPGLFKNRAQDARAVKVSLIPKFSDILARFTQVQPGLKRLRVIWMIPTFDGFQDRFRAEAAKMGIDAVPAKVRGPEDLPEVLRQAHGSADAFWLPPDPLLMTPENLMILREFSWSNAIPFYGSTRGMTREGALASVGASFAEMGTAAAGAARALEAGEKVPELVFPEKAELTLNSEAAERCHLAPPPDLLKKAEHIFP